MMAWLQGLEPRERRLLVLGTVALLVMFFYLVAWEPLAKGVEAQRHQHQQQTALLHWMEQSTAEAKRLRAATGRPAQLARGQSLLAAVDRTARSNQLGDALKRVQPDGDNQARVWLEGASFDRILRWLDALEQQQGVHVVNSVFEAGEEPGRVDARLVLASGGG